MLTRPIPGSDLRVSVLGLGCWAMGGEHWGDDVTDERSRGAIHAALDAGINLFDTSPIYGRADAVLRDALGPRIHDVVVATKVGVGRGEDGHWHSLLTPEHVTADAEASLLRLGVSTIDLLQIHWPCESGTPLAETLGALSRLREQGKVRWFGLCNYDAETLAGLPVTPGLVSLQTPYSMLRREFEGPLRAACEDRSLGVLAYEPLARGLLTGKFRSRPTFPETDQRGRDDRFRPPYFDRIAAFVADLERAASRLSVPTSALALAWVAHRPGVTAVLAGGKDGQQVRANAQALRVLRSQKVLGVLDRIADTWAG